MQLSLPLESGLSKMSLWLIEHPAVVRAALIVLSIALALAAALLAYSPAYACPAASGGSGGCPS